MENPGHTPVRDNKRAVRRKLASSRGRHSKPTPICPVPKRARVESSVADEVIDLTDGDEVPASQAQDVKPEVSTSRPEASSSRIRTFSQCAPNRPTTSFDHEVEMLSQDSCSSSQTYGGGLPSVVWQGQAITSPQLQQEEARQNFGSIRVESPKPQVTNQSSTPYLNKIWKGSKARLNTQAHFTGGLSSSAPGKKEHSTPNGAWIDEMFSLVTQLEEHKSRSPTPDTTVRSSSPRHFTQLLNKSLTATTQTTTLTTTRRTAAIIDTPPDSSNATSGASPLTSLSSRKSATHSATKSDTNTSMFSDSMGDFTADFTLSDAEIDDKTASQKLSQLTEQLRTEIALSQGNSNKSTNVSNQRNTNTDNLNGRTTPATSKQLTNVAVSVTQSHSHTVLRSGVKVEGSQIKPEPITPRTEDVKREPAASVNVKKEAQTPPNIINRGNTGRRARASPGTPLRRYSSHDSVIKSPKPNPLPAEIVTGIGTSPAVSDTTEDSSQEKTTLHIIEEKRKNALSKLKNRRSREGSFVRHKSLDSATIRSSQRTADSGGSVSTAVSAADNLAQQTLQQIIEEKRKQAAEKLLKRKEVDSRDRKDSLSGSLRQLTPPSSQENGGHSSQTLLNPTVFSQTLISGDVKSQSSQPLSQSQSQSNKLSVESIIDDLERNSPLKTKIRPPPSKNSTFKFKRKTDIQADESVNLSIPPNVANNFQDGSKTEDNSISKKEENCRSSTHSEMVKQDKVLTEEEKLKQLIEQKRLAALAKRKQAKASH